MQRALRVLAVLAVALAVAFGASTPLQQAAARDKAASPTVENLGTQISQFLVLDQVLGRDADGKPMLYGSTYVVSDEGVYFFAVDATDGKVVKTIHMADSWGAYHVTAASDGTVYITQLSPSGIARLWAYDPDTEQLRTVGTDTSGSGAGGRFYGVSVAEWGYVYVVAYPSGHLWEYRPDSGTFRDLGLAQSGHSYGKSVLALPGPGRRVLVGTGTPAGLTVFDLDAGTTSQILPAAYAGYSFTYNLALAGDDVLASMVTPDNKLIRFDADTLEFRGASPAQAGNFSIPVLQVSPTERYVNGTPEGGTAGLYKYDTVSGELTLGTSELDWVGSHIWPLDVGGTDYIVSIGANGVYGRWNPATGAVVTSQLVLPGAPTEITSLARGPDGKIYGGTYETDSLFRWDPDADSGTVLGRVAKGRSGEVVGVTAARNRLWTGSYTEAHMTEYDPRQAWHPGSTASDNPRDLGLAGSGQYRPWQMTPSPDEKSVYMVSSSAYGTYGGGLTEIDTSDGTHRTWRGLAGDHNLTSVAASSREIFLGASNHADGLPDVASDPPLVVVAARTHEAVFRTVPVAGAGEITSLVRVPSSGIVFGATENGHWFTFDPATRKATDLGAFPHGVAEFTLGPDGRIYGTTASTVFRVDPATKAVTALAATTVGYWRALAFDDRGRLYWAGGTSLYRLDVGALPASKVTLRANRNGTVRPGTRVTLSAKVTSPRAAGAPTGMVTFYDGNRVVGRADLRRTPRAAAPTITAKARVTVVLRRTGTHLLTARYAGDSRHAPARTAKALRIRVRAA